MIYPTRSERWLLARLWSRAIRSLRWQGRAGKQGYRRIRAKIFPRFN